MLLTNTTEAISQEVSQYFVCSDEEVLGTRLLNFERLHKCQPTSELKQFLSLSMEIKCY